MAQETSGLNTMERQDPVAAAGQQDPLEKRPEQIREEIRETRTEMSETIEAIQDRLSPRHLMNQAKHSVKTAASSEMRWLRACAGDAASTVASRSASAVSIMARRVSENPVPFAAIGLSVLWLFWLRRRRAMRERIVDSNRFEYTY